MSGNLGTTAVQRNGVKRQRISLKKKVYRQRCPDCQGDLEELDQDRRVCQCSTWKRARAGWKKETQDARGDSTR